MAKASVAAPTVAADKPSVLNDMNRTPMAGKPHHYHSTAGDDKWLSLRHRRIHFFRERPRTRRTTPDNEAQAANSDRRRGRDVSSVKCKARAGVLFAILCWPRAFWVDSTLRLAALAPWRQGRKRSKAAPLARKTLPRALPGKVAVRYRFVQGGQTMTAYPEWKLGLINSAWFGSPYEGQAWAAGSQDDWFRQPRPLHWV